MLIPPATSTATWHDLIFPQATRIIFLRRYTPYLRVSDGKTVAMPSCIVTFDGGAAELMGVRGFSEGGSWSQPLPAKLHPVGRAVREGVWAVRVGGVQKRRSHPLVAL